MIYSLLYYRPAKPMVFPGKIEPTTVVSILKVFGGNGTSMLYKRTYITIFNGSAFSQSYILYKNLKSSKKNLRVLYS